MKTQDEVLKKVESFVQYNIATDGRMNERFTSARREGDKILATTRPDDGIERTFEITVKEIEHPVLNQKPTDQPAAPTPEGVATP